MNVVLNTAPQQDISHRTSLDADREMLLRELRLKIELLVDGVSFDVPANTATLGEKIGYYFESDIDYDTTVGGVVDTNVYRKITTGYINAAATPGVPEPSTWAMMLVGVGGVAAASRARSRRRLLQTLAG